MSSKQDDAATRVQEEQERLSAQLHQDQSGASSPSGLLPMMLYNNPLNGDKMTGTDGTSLNLLNGLPSSSAKTASSRIQLAQMMRGEQTGVHSESNSNPSAGKNPPPPMTDAVENETVNSPPQPADGTEGEPELKTVAEPAPKRKHQAASDNSSSSKPKGKKDTKWLATLEELKQYKEANGTCIVPRGYTENPRLASWVAEQRKQYKLLQDSKRSSITQERINLLNELDFAWNAQSAAWTRHMADLRSFKTEYGHCHVPLNHAKYPKLGLWVKEQRRHYTLMKQGKASHMTEDRAKQLDEFEFCWDTHEATWQERLRELSRFRAKHGSCSVPTNYRGNPKLGTWVHHQRRQYKKFKSGKACHITAERIQALTELGFIWNPRDTKGEPIAVKDDESTASEPSPAIELEPPTKKLKTEQEVEV